MEALQLRIPDLHGRELAELLQGWLGATPWAEHISDVRIDEDQTTVTLAEGDRRIELRLRQELRDPDRWRLEAGAWLVPASPSRGWSALIGFTVFGFGLAISLGYLGWSSVAFWAGIAVSLVLGAVVGRVAWRHAVEGRTTLADRARADEVLTDLEPVLRSDERIEVTTG